MVLAGYMRLLKEPMISAYPRRIINIHPSLLPKFPGLAAWEQALDAGERETGCTVHYVDLGMDTGSGHRAENRSLCCPATPPKRFTRASSRPSMRCTRRSSRSSPAGCRQTRRTGSADWSDFRGVWNG